MKNPYHIVSIFLLVRIGVYLNIFNWNCPKPKKVKKGSEFDRNISSTSLL